MGWRGFAAAVAAAALLASASACGSGESAGATDQATPRESAGRDRYRHYLENHADVLVAVTSKLKQAIDHGNLPWAQSWYSVARVHYSSLELAAKEFPALNRRIDGKPNQFPHAHFIGYHRLERGLLGEESLSGLKAPAALLLHDVIRLRRLIADMPLPPVVLLGSAARLVRIAGNAKMAGWSEPFSDTDMVDVSANIEGAEVAVEEALPCLGRRRQAAIRERFDLVYAPIHEWGIPARDEYPPTRNGGAGMHPLEEHSPAERKMVRVRSSKLADELAAAAGAYPETPC
jgi:iron uptake system component EfeO